jgi:hypothetical protein
MSGDDCEMKHYTFYVLYSPMSEGCYVGKTSQPLKGRMKTHKSDSVNENSPRYNYDLYKHIRETGGWENWAWDVIEERDMTREESRSVEGRWVRLYEASLNKQMPGGGCKRNPELCRQRAKEYYRRNVKRFHVKTTCRLCGGKYSEASERIHVKSKKHTQALEALEEGKRNTNSVLGQLVAAARR